MEYRALTSRYAEMKYRRCGTSGLLLPAISLGLWQNFGENSLYQNCSELVKTAFDHGITHFDLANNYGPPPGSAEETFGKIVNKNFKPYRDELIISTKAGYDMWAGPYGDHGSRKYMIASLDQSLKRMKLDYVDIYYSHRPDPQTPVEETMLALDQAVRQGKALYAGISNYNAEQSAAAIKVMKDLKTPFIIHQAKYSMLERWVENSLLTELEKNGLGCIAFSPLAQGLLTGKYLDGIPADSRAAGSNTTLRQDQFSPAKLNILRQLNLMAIERGQTLSQMAIAWLLKDQRVCSVLIGASKKAQLLENISALEQLTFTDEEITQIELLLNTR